MKVLRPVLMLMVALCFWQIAVVTFHLKPYLLPGPVRVLTSWYHNMHLIMHNSLPTLIEIVVGLVLGVLFGSIAALLIAWFKPLRLWFLPVLLVSQALPTFAIAPILVYWFGYGVSAKIITTMIMLFFPVTNAFYDGLRRTPQQWLASGKVLGASPWRQLINIRVPAALPSLASGIRVATAIAPIGAIVGEWVGASSGLGFLMLNANARMQIDLMFATLFTLVIYELVLYYLVDILLARLIYWKA